MRRVILNLHLFTALFAGVFMVIQGLTGSVMEFEPELDRSFHPHFAYIRPAGQSLSIKEIISAVSRQVPGESVVAYVPSLSPKLSCEVLLPSGVAYVNQYTGEVLGVRARGQTFLGYVRALHVRLGIGAIGRNVVRWSAVAALFSAISGLYLWWPTKQVTIHVGRASRRMWFDLHSAIGIWLFIPLALLAASGIILGFEDQATPLIYKLTRSGPTMIPRSTGKATTVTPSIDADTAVAIARSRLPGAIPDRVQMPQYGGLYRIELLDSSDRISGSRNIVTLDPADGTVVSLSRAADLSRGDWVMAVNEAVHTGNIFGLPSRILASLASIVVPLQGLSGAFIWLHRKKILPVVDRLVATERSA
jgi:uncharacterized iron-regulated membrane protein